jgi:signal transduction histidine kinase/CheY-like chemotaxis protein
MHSDASHQTTDVRRPVIPAWGHGAIGLALLAAAAILDITKPFDKTWSIFYLLPVLYAGWTLRGRLELLLHAAVLLTVFLAPMVFRPQLLWAGTGIYNRSFGVLLGGVVILLLWERRRYVSALQRTNNDLERRVLERTAELEVTNDLLRREIAEREKAEADQTRLEEQLREAMKMEAIGHLAGGVAHDFNNLLTVINGYCSLLRDEVPADSTWHHSIVEVHKAGERAAEVTQQLLAFSRKQMLQPKIVNINHAIVGAESLLRRLLPEHIRLSMDLDPTVRPILADPGQLVQVLLNLASNARDAMPEGGEFSIKTEPVVVTRDQITWFSDLSPGSHIRLSVSDTGQGLDEATRQHVFEPFFTTKEVGKGTGLGLASVYGIVKQSQGHIDLASEPGRGTTFTILWPCVAATSTSVEETPQPAIGLPRGRETIMLVEDEDQVRAFGAVVLRGNGYRVLEARNGQEAWTLATGSDARPLDLLITDVIMPEMGGPALARRLAPFYPGLKVLFMTGYAKTEAIEGLGQPGFLLEKPFSVRELLTTVREVLQITHTSPLGNGERADR